MEYVFVIVLFFSLMAKDATFIFEKYILQTKVLHFNCTCTCMNMHICSLHVNGWLLLCFLLKSFLSVSFSYLYTQAY